MWKQMEYNKQIQLPQPNKEAVCMTLFEALQNRKSSREFSRQDITLQTLSQLLWAACGINRPEEMKLTAPSAMNRQSVSLYVCKFDGAYLWDASKNALTQVCATDIRALVTNGQGGIGNYPLAIVIVGKNAKFDAKATSGPVHIVSLDAALVCQNINLAATALKLNNVPRVNMDVAALKKALHLTETQFPIMNNLLGH